MKAQTCGLTLGPLGPSDAFGLNRFIFGLCNA